MIHQIAEDVYQIALLRRNAINAYLVDNILIDAGIKYSGPKLISAIGDKEVKAHAITHAHADHQGASSFVCNHYQIPFWSSEAEKQYAETGNATAGYPYPNHLITKFQKKFWAGDGHPVQQILKEGDSVGTFRVVETPGHSKGHLSFFREKDGVLIVGDVLVNMNLLTTLPGLHEPPDLFTADLEQNRESIKKIARLRPKIMCFGHGPVLYDKGELHTFCKKTGASSK
ncbi:glyoxylase-like metal-dependent hydrolase (beta-lactamase superfamily II) [Lacibacter cauensis]|uniref:Glyoxylase-like metal-dependent hydrolase (Beta-lactamase superfamily II) n=1 Tax=Lacibacter cauensis TaxID=510947 RepID=A0A562SYG4_9BACT|nr:MBL fold metallo-hydrolase [Lacibacter cauensis]TWI85756.1 glyoxylase-like metal-dependent hydrolase (beta-lactamase superfamily II) [Lacibacter cauensis]